MTLQTPIDRIAAMNDAFFSNNLQEAKRLSQLLLPVMGDAPAFLFMSGVVEYRLGNPLLALEHLNRLRTVVPDHAQGLELLGLIHSQLGDMDQAIACLQGLGHNEALFLLGRCYLTIGAYAAAVIPLDKVKAQYEVRLELGRACKEAGLLERAEALFLEVIGADVIERHWATMWLGDMLIKEQRWAELGRVMTPLLDDPQTFIAARTVFASANLQLGDLDQAAVWLPTDQKTNWGHAFSVQVNTHLRLLLRAMQVPDSPRRAHPYPDSDVGVSCLTLNKAGRFTHQMMDYLGLRWYADAYGLPVETPDWPGHYVFELDDPLPTGRRRTVRRVGAWLEKQVAAIGPQALAGFDFYSIGGLLGTLKPAHVAKAREVFKIRSHWITLLNPLLEALRSRGRTVLSVHIRMTDLSGSSPPLSWYTEWLEALWPSLDQPVLYLASDDLDAVLPAFEAFRPCTLQTIATPLPALDWLQDFYVLMHADVVANSAGGFCTMASMLNLTGQQFYRPDLIAQCLVRYDPMVNP